MMNEHSDRPPDFEERLRSYARYFALIQKQHEALDREDMAEVVSLAEERQRLEQQLPLANDLAASDDPIVRDLVAQLRDHLQNGLHQHRSLVDRMKLIRADLAAEIGGLEERTSALRAYVREDSPEARHKVDLKF